MVHNERSRFSHRLGVWIGGLMMIVAGTAFAQADEPDDPFAWLEEVAGEKPLSWVKERNSESVGTLTRDNAFHEMESRILQILDSKDRIPGIAKHGEFYYNFWRDAQNPRGLWRRTTLDEYRKPNPKWETVLDVDALGKEEKTNWVFKGAQFLRPGQQRALVSLSRGGADAAVVREFDVASKSFVKDGFSVPEAKSQVSWRGKDELFVGTDFGSGSLTTSGYPRIIKSWKRGTPLSEAKTLFEAKPDDMGAYALHDSTPGFERDFIERRPTFWTEEIFYLHDGKLTKIDKPDDAKFSVHREWLLLELRTEWKVGGQTYPAGALIAAPFDKFLAGDRSFQLLFEPTERTSLAGFSPTRNHVLLNVLDNVRSRIYVLTFKDGAWAKSTLPGVPEIGSARAGAVDDEESDDYFLSVDGFLTPDTLALGTIGKGPAETLKQLPKFFNADGLAVTQHEATSKDGTKIPYFEVARSDLKRDGSNPTLLYGYGGFEIPMQPGYRPAVGAAWLEKGGVYVVANIRGGGEFGPRWHQSALKANRHRAYDDFIAVAEDLIARKVTSPSHLGIQGGSNGGLLMGNMLTRRPDLFGAIVCQVPLLDMRRFNKLLAGASWMGEYGNPDKPEEWAFIQGFSPYHNVKKEAKYPPTLFTTSTRDDRVHPGHARKMVALMKSQGHNVLYYENTEGGHAGAADNKQAAFMQALAYTFLWNRLH
ncbi:MAG: prolyl oligopeptidase family serine peptidase [Isosphaeraceae bacterium]